MPHHEACFPWDSASYYVTVDSAEEIEERDSAFVGRSREMIILHSQPYDPRKEGGVMPWDLPNFVQDEDTPGRNAYGRREVANWDDMLLLFVKDSDKGLSVNQHFKDLPTQSGHTIRGNVVVVRHLEESGCGDYVSNLPIDASRLAEIGLSFVSE